MIFINKKYGQRVQDSKGNICFIGTKLRSINNRDTTYILSFIGKQNVIVKTLGGLSYPLIMEEFQRIMYVCDS